MKTIAVRLDDERLSKLDALVGSRGRAPWIRAAISEKIARDSSESEAIARDEPEPIARETGPIETAVKARDDMKRVRKGKPAVIDFKQRPRFVPAVQSPPEGMCEHWVDAKRCQMGTCQ